MHRITIRESSANAREFARLLLMHGQIRNLLAGEQQAREAGALDSITNRTMVPAKLPDDRTTGPKIRQGQGIWNRSSEMFVAAMAATVLIALGIYFSQLDNSYSTISQQTDFATVKHLSGVVWKSDEFKEQDRLGIQTLELQSGILCLQFDNGVDVTLEGPAKYQLVSGSKTMLNSGVLVASVPEGAEGFRVDTPSAQVIDLGTSFGVNVSTDGVADSLAFEGEVEVTSGEFKSVRTIAEGESVRLDATGGVESTDFNASRFAMLWPISSGMWVCPRRFDLFRLGQNGFGCSRVTKKSHLFPNAATSNFQNHCK